jgi:hypothetical protein
LGSGKATADFTSGNTYNFASETPLSIEVTAENGDKKTYTVIVNIAESLTIGLLTVDGKAATYDDLFLSAFSDYAVEFLTAEATAPADINAFYDKYNLIVIHSNVAGTNATGLATKSLVGVKPILNMKAFLYNSGRWNWSTPSNTEVGRTSVTVSGGLQNHPIFDKVTFSGNSLTLYGEATTVNNAVQYSGAFDGSSWTTGLTNANHTLATVDGDEAKIVIHEINTNNEAKYLLIGLSMEGDSYTKFNTNTVELLKNAAAYLLNGGIYYDYVTNQPTDNNITEVQKSIEYAGDYIMNPKQEDVFLFNSIGTFLLSSKEANINLQAIPSGLYIAKARDGKVIKFVK